MRTRINALTITVVITLIILSCGNNNTKKSNDTNEVEKIEKTSVNFDVNNPNEWPVKFADFGFTPETYAQAESYSFMKNFIDRNGINNIFHFKTLAKAEDKWVVSPNNDVLYSMVTVDATDDFTLVIPPTKDDRFISYQIVDGNHFTPVQDYGSGVHFFPKGTFTTPHVAIGIRIVVNPTDAEDIAYVASEVQPKMKIIAKSSENHLPAIDIEGMEKLRAALMPYYDELDNTFGGMTEDKSTVTNEWFRMLCTAGAWGLSEDEHAMYIPYAPGLSAEKAFTATYQVPPQDEFWSITMYNADKYLVSNDRNTMNKYNTVFNDDGTFTVCFGSEEQCGDAPNRVDIVDGWNFLMRAYRPDVEGFKQYKMPEVVEYVKK